MAVGGLAAEGERARAGARRAYGRLRLYNGVMAVLHLAQGAAILALSNDFALPVTATFIEGPPGTDAGDPDQLFEIPVGPAIAAFVFISALAHTILVLPGSYEWYVRNLERTRNDARWLEYSLSSSIRSCSSR